MAFLHSRGMVHGALHSRNVLLCSDATDRVRGWSAVVGDYGLVRGCAADAASASENRMALLASASCVAHMAPDVLLGGPVSWESDVYSFGVLLWEMWSGRKAWRNLSPVNVMHAVALEGCTLPLPANAPQGLLGLMAKCLDTGRRPPFPEIVEDLNRQLAAQNVGA